jgi:hypothetical protein
MEMPPGKFFKLNSPIIRLKIANSNYPSILRKYLGDHKDGTIFKGCTIFNIRIVTQLYCLSRWLYISYNSHAEKSESLYDYMCGNRNNVYLLGRMATGLSWDEYLLAGVRREP